VVEEPLRYHCPRSPSPPNLSGAIDDRVWNLAPWTHDFVDIEGDAKPKPGFRTRAKMLWDDEFLYIAAEMEEPHVWAMLTERDSIIFQDNDFEVFIDPDGDAKSYFELEINALNTVWDLWLEIPYRDGGQADSAWSIKGLRTSVNVKGTINNPSDIDDGWSVEIAIPWKSLEDKAGARCPPRRGDVWRINFSRVRWQTTIEGGQYKKIPNTPEHNWVWSPQGVIDMHQPEMWGYIEFVERY
jgi:hypothetical protein